MPATPSGSAHLRACTRRWVTVLPTCVLAVCGANLLRAQDVAPTRPGSPTISPPPAATGTEDDPGFVNPVYTHLPVTSNYAKDDASSSEPTPEQLLSRFIELHSKTDYPNAAEVALRLTDAAPDRPLAHYNLACVMCKLNRFDAALAALDRSVDCGWRSIDHLEIDPDLDGLRELPGYAALIKKLRTLIAEEAIKPLPLRNDELDQIVADVQSQAPELLKRYHVPGMSVAIVHDGHLAWTSGLGVREQGTETPMDADTVFRLHTPLQLMALMAGMLEQDAGRLQLARVLEQAADLDRLAYRRSTPGVGPSALSVTTIASRLPASRTRRLPSEIRLQPGAASYSFLRLAVEATSSQDFNTYCAQRVFPTLNMRQSATRLPMDLGALAVGHSVFGTPVPIRCPGEDRAWGGCLYTTAADLARMIEAAISVPSSDASDSDNPFDIYARTSASIRGGLKMAFKIENTSSGQRIQLVDTTGGQGCLMRWYPQRRSGVVIAFNAADGVQAAEHLAQIALGGP
jgi:CubicO group peptidase (beta-lactamase class C family)